MNDSYPQWWRVDLGSVQPIKKAVVVWYGDTDRSYKYRIEISDNGSSYTTIVDQTSRTETGISTDYFSASARYVRVTVTGVSPSGWAGLRECKIFGPGSDATPPATPTGLIATAGDGCISLDWAGNTESDLSSYTVKRAIDSGGPYTTLATDLLLGAYTDNTVTVGVPYYYVVTAMDTNDNESGNSNEGSTTCLMELLSEGQPVTASSSESGNPAANGNDGDFSTRWTAANDSYPQWWRVDLGSVQNLDKAVIYWFGDTTRSYKYRIEVSDNDVNYTTIVDQTSRTATGTSTDTFDASARYVRVTVTGTSYGWAAFWECQIFGSSIPPAFTTDPINNLEAVELASYSGQSLADFASDPAGDPLTFSKDSGPTWLVVAGDGTLSGVPSDSDTGENTFTVRVTDDDSLYDTATMTIQVDNTYSGTEGLIDLLGFAAQWLSLDCVDVPACNGADLDGDDDVTVSDFSVLAHNWLGDEALQLHLKFNETSGDTAYDNSIYWRPGTLVNAPAWDLGHSGGALLFDGTNDHVEVSGYQGIPGGGSRTCMAWIKTASVSGEILTWGEEYNGGRWVIRVNEGGQLRAEVQGGNIIGTTVINNDTWHHVAVVVADDGSPDIAEAQLYVDGQLETISSFADEPINSGSAEDVKIGAYLAAGGPRYFQGLIDEVRIYNTALTEQEIAEITQ